jgi:RNA polymerase sigma-70 factor (ECF subfamily)
MKSTKHLHIISSGESDTVPGRSDDHLMSLAAAGDAVAFAELVRRHEKRVRAFCELLLKDRRDAVDAAQEVFVRLWAMRERYQPRGRFKELLFTAARNGCRSVQRKRILWALLPLESAREEPSDDVAPSESMIESERVALVTAALKRLPPDYRVPLALRFFEGMPYEEIARVIQRTPATARSRVHFGLKKLAQLLPDEVYP